MKFKVKSSLNEMAFNRSVAIRRVQSYADTLFEHLLKCVVFGDTTGNLTHWINEEIAVYLSDISEIEVKTKNGKLNKIDYETALLSDIGENLQDYKSTISSIRASWRKRDKYPFFPITNELVNKMYIMYTSIIKQCSEIFIQKEPVDIQVFIDLVMTIYNNIN